jgi:hypothetical protein
MTSSPVFVNLKLTPDLAPGESVVDSGFDSGRSKFDSGCLEWNPELTPDSTPDSPRI